VSVYECADMEECMSCHLGVYVMSSRSVCVRVRRHRVVYVSAHQHLPSIHSNVESEWDCARV